MAPAEKIRNVGPKSAAWLRQVGIKTGADIAELGAVEAFLKVKRAGFRPSLNLLYALAGAIADCHWAELPAEQKSALLLAVEQAESANPIKTRWQRNADASARGAATDTDTEEEAPGAGSGEERGLFDDAESPTDSDDRGSSRFD